MINYLQRWMNQLRWQRLAPFEELAVTLLKHLDGIANYCRSKVRMGMVEAVNGNIRMLINRGRGYKNLRYLLLKAKRLAVSNLELLAVAQNRESRVISPTLSDSRSELEKETIQDLFRRKLATCEKDVSTISRFDWSGLELVLTALRCAFQAYDSDQHLEAERSYASEE